LLVWIGALVPLYGALSAFEHSKGYQSTGMIKDITVRGARTHNLRDIDVTIPRNSLTVITGLSGSGKSSLAFDTIYAEGQRRYIESLSAYARQFLDQMERPDVDSIEGLSPSISIEQKTTSRSPRSTVGTITEIYDYLRLLWSSIGTPHCPKCSRPIARQTTEQIIHNIMELGHNGNEDPERIMVLAPIVRGRKGEFTRQLEKLEAQGWTRARIDGQLRPLDEPIKLEKRKNHTIEIVVDRLLVKEGIEKRLEESVEAALKLADGLVLVAVVEGEEELYSDRMACAECGISVPRLEPRSFSFNSPYGACPECKGLGSRYDFDPAKIIIDWSKPLFDGGLGPGGSSTYFQRLVQHAARTHKFKPALPFEDYPRRTQNFLLFGSANGKSNGRKTRRGFPGIIPLLRRGYEEAGSDDYREWMERYMSSTPCAACKGNRLRPASLAVRVAGTSIDRFTALPISRAAEEIKRIEETLRPRQRKIALRLVREIGERVDFLLAVGLGYLALERSASTLSGGEAQRVRLATQIGSRLRGVLYVLDEPSIGLHHRDNQNLIATLENLRALGNTVVAVEPDEDTLRRCGRRARRRHYPPRRPRHRPRSRRRRPGRPSGCRWPAGGNRRRARIAYRALPRRGTHHPRAGETPQAQCQACHRGRRGGTQPQELDGKVSLGSDYLCHRRERFRQVHPR
jgi:excinuclease ABC subunit A